MGSDAIARLRKAVDNQAALGEGEFRLPIMDMCRLVQRASEEAGGADLPVDADGKSVPLGTATLYRHDGSALAVDCYMRDPADGEWMVLDTTGAMSGASELYLERPDSWERLEDDLFDLIDKDIASYCRKRGIDHEIKPFDWHMPGEIKENVCRDVIARAKRLAGAVE